MRVKVKVHFLRTNPKITCELALPGEITVETLRRIVCTLFLPELSQGQLQAENRVLTDQQPVSELGTHSIGVLSLEAYPEFRFGIEMLGLSDEACEAPELIRVRGYALPANTTTIRSLNAWMEWRQRKYPVDEMRERLRRLFTHGHTGLARPRREAALPVDHILRGLNKEELKYICGILMPELNVYQTKEQLIAQMVDKYKLNSTFDRVMELLELSDYLALKAFFLQDGDASQQKNGSLHFLTQLGLVRIPARGTPGIAETFLKYLETRFSNGNDEKYIEKKQIESIIRFGCDFYGALPKTTAVRLFETYYGTDHSSNLFEKAWGKADGRLREVYCCYLREKDAYYNGRTMTADTAGRLLDYMKRFREEYWYIPSKEAYEKMLCDGIGFEREDLQQFMAILPKERYMTDQVKRNLARAVFDRIRFDWGTEEIVSWVTKQYHFSYYTNRIKKEMTDFLESKRSHVGRLTRLGHTPEAWAKISAVK